MGLDLTLLQIGMLATLEAQPRHGLVVRADLIRRGMACSIGGLYVGLRRLERWGLLDGQWETSVRHGARRYIYTLTPVGRVRLKVERARIQRVVARRAS